MARKKKKEYASNMDQDTIDFFNNYDGDPFGSIGDSNSQEYLTDQDSIDYYNNFFKDYDTELKNYYDKYVTPRQEAAEKEFEESKPKVGKDKFTQIGVDTINEDEYQFLVNIDNKLIEEKKRLYKKNNNRNLLPSSTDQYYNEYSDKGWIINNGKYYKPLAVVDKRNEDFESNKKYLENKLGLNNKKPSLENNKSTTLTKFKDNIIEVKGKKYVEVTDEKPMTLLESKDYIAATKVNNTYDKYFKKFNEAVEKGEYNTANNIIQKINEKYFGHSYEDGLLGSSYFNNKDKNFLQEKQDDIFNEKLIVSKALENTPDYKTSEELKKRLAQLNFEEKLINYNRSISIASINEKANRLENITSPVNDSWMKTDELWSKTLEDWQDNEGNFLTDTFGTAKNILNNTMQTVGSLGKNVTSGFSAIESLIANDLDDGQFKEVWAPAVLDVATYIIPYVGQARIISNYLEPASVISSFITQEGSSTIDTYDGNIKVANKFNAIGAAVNISANFISDLVFAGIRASFNKSVGEKTAKELSERWFKNSGANIAKNIIKSGSLEAIEEFAQTYGEYMQNITSEELPPGFFKEHFKEAFESAFVAMVVSSGAEGVGSTIGAIRSLNSQTLENYRVNEAISDKNDDIEVNKTTDAGIAYNASDIDNYEKLNNSSYDNSQVNVGTVETATEEIATELSNNNVVTLVNSNVADTDVLSDPHSIQVGNTDISDNATVVLSPSQEMANYIKKLNKNAVVFIFDPDSDTFNQDLIDFMENSNSRMVFKNLGDFTTADYKFSPKEIVDINNIVTDYRKKGNVLDNINGKVELKPVKTSDIQDTNITTFMNDVKYKILEDIENGVVTKETSQKEFKKMCEKLSEYLSKSTSERKYMQDNTGKILSFIKTGNNTYEVVNTIPKSKADLQVYANVKTTGNIINGNLNSKIGITKGQANAVNKMIDTLKLKGNYLTTDSTGKEVATLIKLNKTMSKEILQALGADGLIEGKTKVRLYTAFDNLDNANPKGAIKNTNKLLESNEFKNETKKSSETEAPKQVTKKVEPSKVDIESEPIKVKDVAYDADNTTELNNAELEKLLDEAFDGIAINDKMTKVEADKLKTTIRKLLFDRYTNIRTIADNKGDYNVKEAVANLEAVASDAQNMIASAQTNSRGEIIGKSLKQIYSKLKNKKEKKLFEKYMLLELNIERENAGAEKIFEKMSKDKSRKLADKILKNHPKFKDIANDIRIYNENLLNMLVEGGVITEELSNKLKRRYTFYMPIYSSELSTFADLDNGKYFKNMKLDDTIKDATKSGKHIQTLEKSLENKTYNVLSAIAKNKLANEMASSGNYESDGSGEMIYYSNGKPMKIKTSNAIIDDISNNSLLHIVDKLNEIPVLKQIIAASNLSYRFILDPIYQVKNVVIDFTDSQLIYSKDKKNFAKNYVRASIAIANNSEVFNEFKEVGLAEYGTGWTAPKVKYDKNGNISYKQNKFQRLFANLEALPKLAEYLSLKDRYINEVKKDYEAGKYTKKSLISKKGIDFNEFNSNITKGHDGKPVYISRFTSSPDEIEYINTYEQNSDGYGWWYANSPTHDDYYNSSESDAFMDDLFDKSTVDMIKAKKGVFATISEERLDPPTEQDLKDSERYNYIEGRLTGKVFDISGYEGFLPFDVSDESEIDTREKFKELDQKRRDKVTEIYTYLKNKYDKDNKYSLDDFRKYLPLIDALKLSGYSGIVGDYNDGTKEIVIFDESKFMPLTEYEELSSKNAELEQDNSENNMSIKDTIEQAKLKAKVEAQDVNLNFNSGGTLSKAMSKAGFKFLNAGMLGFDKFVAHVSKDVETPKGMGSLLFEFTSIGLTTALANQLLNGDDEDYDKLPYYYKNNYYMIKVGDNSFLRIPKGRVQTLYNVLFEYSTGIKKEDSAKEYLKAISTAFDSAVLPPDFSSSAPYAAWKAVVDNKSAFGNEIYSEEYDSLGEKTQKGIYHLLSSYFGRYGRIVKDITDDDPTTDWFNELEYYKDTTKANRHYSTALDLVTYYQNKDNIKTLDDKMMKKYIDTQNAALRSINSEINEGKKSGLNTKDLAAKYAARDDLVKSMVNNYKLFDKSDEGNGIIRYYFDEHCFEYNPYKDRITKKY